ncbi:MAG TPA: hypothetical protein VK745_25940 [Polyangiaceae bacterium]|jgi:hypothetical protein|nr:hypothetical protein [Polyangiaceae bacterium]
MMRQPTWGSVFVVVIAGCVGACSGAVSNDHGDTGGSSGLGAGGAGAPGVVAGGAGAPGGFGGAGTVQAQGALTATVAEPVPMVAQMSCPVVDTYEIGAPEAPTTTDPGASVVNGSNGSTISCSVSGQGTFAFSGSLRGVTAQGDEIAIAFSNGSVGPDGTGSTDVNFYTPQLSTDFSSATPCSVTVEDQQVKPGAIWASFQCAQVESPPSGLCGLQGVVVFENCDGSLSQ